MTLARFQELLAVEEDINRRHWALFCWVEVFTDRVFRDRLYALSRACSRVFKIDSAHIARATIDTRAPCSSEVIGDHEHELVRVVHDPRMGDIRRALLMFKKDPESLAFKADMERYIDHLKTTRRALLDQLEENLVRLAHELPIVKTADDVAVVYRCAAAQYVTHKSASYLARGRVALEAALVCEPLGIDYVIRPPPYDDSPRAYELEAHTTLLGWQIASRRADRSAGAIVRGCAKLGLNPRIIDPTITDPTL